MKPNYNSVDLAEVELVDTKDSEPRGNDSDLLAVSKKILIPYTTIKQLNNESKYVPFMQHNSFIFSRKSPSIHDIVLGNLQFNIQFVFRSLLGQP